MLGVMVPFRGGLGAARLAVTVRSNHTATVRARAGDDNGVLVACVGLDGARDLDGSCHLIRIICWAGIRGRESDAAGLAKRLLGCHFSATVRAAKTPVVLKGRGRRHRSSRLGQRRVHLRTAFALSTKA